MRPAPEALTVRPPAGGGSPTSVPGPVRVVGVLMALWCVGFATANVVLETTGRVAEGRYAEYAAGLAVMNWLVLGLKLVGAGVAVLAVLSRPRLLAPPVVGTLLWAVAGTLGLYAAGSVVEGVGLVAGVIGDGSGVRLLDVAYVAFFLAAAAGYLVLAVSYGRRHGLGRRRAVLGLLLGPVVLGLVLLAVPAVLVVLGVMPPY